MTTTSEIGWRGLKIVGFIGIVGAIALSQTCVQAQITPDTTLGSENSVVTPNVVINGTASDRIDGGAIRSTNLFHSFQEFNIDAGRGAYFSNPAGIENILSRVTGNNPSNILGTLGVLGNANLFLINPNGIIFGQGASLDIQGSFVASTADRIQLGDSGYFNATEPQQSSLLAVTPGALFFNQVASQPGNIINTGNLAVGKNLTLSADNLNLQGQLLAGENLILQANDTVQVRDSVVNPFIAAAGGKLLVQGQAIDIFALNHANSGLFAGKDLVLRANTIGGDAHFWSGGNFRIEQLDGSLGDWYSLYDPIIFVAGDLFFNDYVGTSLHILAGGSVIVPGTIAIMDADTASTSIAEDITLSDGTVLPIDGSDRPTLDIRAGVDPAIVSSPDGIAVIGSGLFFGGEYETNPSSADISIGNIIIDPPDGVVYLTNQYQPNLSLTSANIKIIGEGFSRIGAEFQKLGIDARGIGGNGSSVVLDSRGSIFLNQNASINSSSDMSQSGDIRLITNEQISLGSKSSVTSFSDFGKEGDISLNANEIQLAPFASILASGDGGDIQIQGNRLLMQEFSQIVATTTGTEAGGSIFIQANDSIRIDGGNIFTFVGLFGSPQTSGDGGGITIKTGDLSITGTALFVGEPFPNGFRTGGDITSDTLGSGDAGTVTIDARQVRLTNGAQIRASTLSTGNAGDVIIRASESVEVSGLSSDDNFFVSKIASQVNSGATGTGGDVLIETKQRLTVSDGAQIQAGTFGSGSGGSLTVNATQSIDISDTVIDDNPTGLFTGPEGAGASGTGGDLTVTTGQLSMIGGETNISSEVNFEASGNAGDLLIEISRLVIGNGGRISAATFGTGQGGNLTVKASESINLLGVDNTTEDTDSSSLSTATFGGGNAGNLTIQTGLLSVRDGAIVSAATLGQGNAGSLRIDATESIEVRGRFADGLLPSELSTAVGSDATGQGGDLSIVTRQLTVQEGGQISASTSGNGRGGNIDIQAGSVRLSDRAQINASSQQQGNAGSITINADNLIESTNSDILTFADQASGGEIAITAQDIRLRGDSDIQTNVASGTGGGGNITLTANSILAFDDSDILAFAQDGRGGNIALNTPVFFGENFQPAALNSDPSTLDGNNRVDINASGAVAGVVDIPDVSFIQNSLTELPANLTNTETLVANSCVARSRNQAGSFLITGAGGLPSRPGEQAASTYSTGSVRSVPDTSSRTWQLGDRIVEPQGAYRLSNGRLILSRECS
ncbi:filamentous hemagglutinin N-terminal domain-containing protein [Gloeocapsopsis sp. IPPAS B-1203]|uniref:two-partner secretion domain-containing protein n=1 Tax=Gloeocapsopsis sp. IPPAS B-1203 TaxID=2049454 RepID=UPI000C194363|nr:filamentous hemagglutinin N-terminal domain-containing protein [Gloeocapsopsis sp. IPPAS B-1203]PIG92230.1 hypothetical protein CSQ79_16480 [Gloeocapsopsis sp. IPPAS B-1203]